MKPRSCASVKVSSGVGGASELSAQASVSGQNSAVPLGMVHDRFATVGSIGSRRRPARNHTWPLWPKLQSTGPSLIAQLCATAPPGAWTGVCKTHCHHSTDHSAYVCPWDEDCGGMT